MKDKIIIIVLCLFVSINMYSYEYVEQPMSYEFQSTSQLMQTSYIVPFAAKNININDDYNKHNIRKARGIDDDDENPGYNPSNPEMTPIGEPYSLFIIIFLYLILKIKKFKIYFN